MPRGRWSRGRAEGRTEGLEFERRLLGSQASRRFGPDAGERLSALLAGVTEPERLAAVGDAIIDCGTGTELLTAVRRILGVVNSAADGIYCGTVRELPSTARRIVGAE